LIFVSPDDLPPKIFREKGELKGTYVDIIREICKRMNVEPEFEIYPWSRAIVMVKTGKADAVFPPFVTKERLDYLYFTQEPMSYTRNQIFALKKDNIVVKNLSNLKGLVVGVNNDYSYGPEFDTYKKNLALDVSINEETLANKLGKIRKVKRIDVAIGSSDSFRFLNRRLGYVKDFEVVYELSETPSYVAFSKAKGESAKVVAEKFSKILLQLKREGFVQKITDRYTK
jgi:polar amino acid transport system substrate-binding protein